MRFRKPPENRKIRMRLKITAVLLSLTALWGFAAWVTVGDGWNLLQTSERDQTAGRPTKTLINVLQDERRASLVYLAARHRNAVPPDLSEQRARTDQAIARWRRTAKDAPGDKIQRHIELTSQRLQALTAIRNAIDSGTIDAAAAAKPYNDAIDAGFLINMANAELDDPDISADGRSLIALTRARELLSREDALAEGLLTARHMSGPEATQFAQAVGLSRYALEDAYGQLHPSDQARYDAFASGAAFARLRTLEDRIVAQSRSVSRPPTVTPAQWETTTRPVLTQLDNLVDEGGDAVVKRAQPIGYGVILRLILIAGLGLGAVVASIVLAVTTSRLLVRQLRRLKIAAQELSERRLPDVVERLSRGEKVDVAAEAPPLQFGDDEIGQVGQEINRVQEIAIAAAVGQAEQRRGFREVLRNQALRTQALSVQQHHVLDRVERRRDLDPEVFGDILKIDEVATRIRRHTGNILLLSGGQAHRGARRPMVLMDVIRLAIGQVENYQRVNVPRLDDRWLSGRALDVTSLLAELIENALSFSEPDTTVEVTSQATANGLAIMIEDKGLGLRPDQLEAVNRLIADPPPFDAASSSRLGLLVVGLIARRHGITVTLKGSAFGGIMAVVLLPNALFEAEPPAPTGGLPRREIPRPDEGPVRQNGSLALLRTAEPAPPALRVAHSGDTGPQETPPAPVEAAPPAPEPRPAEPEAEEEDVRTTHGLPIRQPQASIVEQLRTEQADPEPEPEPEVDTRSPEDVLRIMGSFQRGTRQGRADARRAGTGEQPQVQADEHVTVPGDQ
ncbi:nitrate- and nitrite sensing domain-containing protein [Actinomadura rayongensis]|uniref:histidine kinase n=1 Tax=Actinomadura rayongensis TaxID=1429076 RepID=A0A6I4W1K3_9ACTN|nr:nitrate- and nitrite sensing domain-containing protein [Actinomadura rayongensis]MXQ62550.1 histidine kinase [Actinomadura rayongensis]